MINIFDKFNDRAKNVIYNAREYSTYYRNNFIGSEHILLSLMENKGKVLEKTLAALNINKSDVKNEVERYIKEGEFRDTSGNDNLTTGAKRVIKLSFEEANYLKKDYVGDEHLFLGLIRENESIGSRVLYNLGINLDKARQKVREYTKSSKKSSEQISEEEEYLKQFTNNLIEMAKKNKLDPVIAREDEIERLIHILSRRVKNNPVLVGEAGVGKTAIVEGLALKIVEKKIPEILHGKTILLLDMASVLAGAKYMGEFEERLKKVINIIKSREDIILFIDEIHTIIGAGRSQGAMDAANILKPALARGELQCIGATTVDEYRKYIEKDPALERRFQPIFIKEPSVNDTVRILKGLREKYEVYHGVKISDEAITTASKLSARYISDRFLPDKAVDLLDEAAAKVKLDSLMIPDDIYDIEKKLENIKVEKESAFNDGDYEKVAKLGVEEKKLQEEYEKLKNEWNDKRARNQSDNVVRFDDVAQIISKWSGVPVTKITVKEGERLLNMEKKLHERVISQDEAIRKVSEVIRTSRAGLTDPSKPNGTFLFLGPTGVGKTEVAKAVTEFLYGDENLLIRLDMSEYMEKHAVAKLIGSPPGYVGYDEGGQLTEKVRKKPYSVILLDEIEKAHTDVFNILLQIFDDGRLTDAKGRTVDFKNSLIIMTSNIGADMIMDRTKNAGKDNIDKVMDNIRNDLETDLRKYFKPEFINRIDEIVVFKSLNHKDIKKIIKLQISDLEERLKNRDLELDITDNALDWIADIGYDPAMGARPLKRVINSKIVNEISKMILAKKLNKNDIIKIDYKDNELKINKRET
ncbi:MAG TPA: ATP-dependent Clp protease ATP-binding subunit [Candidatus Mcinerneyibacterium sp.]|nr:ATP-dependent Clp protease ATP-binding subunit [Candidatus Mcinerneyibacterium sp.]